MNDKVSKRYAHYTDNSKKDISCIDCTMWRRGECSYVEGDISANGYCRFFKQANVTEDAPTNAMGGGSNIATFSPIMGFLRRRKKLREVVK